VTHACILTTTSGLPVEVRERFMGDDLGILLGHSTTDSEPTLIFTCKKEGVRLTSWHNEGAVLRADRLALMITADSAADLSHYLGIAVE